jgi:glycogen debranching enzyme
MLRLPLMRTFSSASQKSLRTHLTFALVLSIPFFSLPLISQVVPAEGPVSHLELSRPVRSWEFLPVVGTKAALFGTESGQMEAWVYPLKILRNFHVTFHVAGRSVPAESLVRTIIVHPESATLVYADDDYSVRETLFVPIQEQGAAIIFEVATSQPLEIEVGFIGDFQLQWPAGLGGSFLQWIEAQHAVVFGEESKRFAALIGSPSAASPALAYQTNFSANEETSFRLGVTRTGRDTKIVILAGSTEGYTSAQQTYQHISSAYRDLLLDSQRYYAEYLKRTVQLTLPDPQLQQAYDWSRISMIQGLVTNPYLGTGLVAGYRTSGTSQRPGFAWFFGRDSFWTSFALNSVGDFSTTRVALEFIAKFQRDDGKIPHEIAQGASFVNWFKDYPYGYASADATPLYIIAVNDYVVRSGDVEFAKQHWDSVWKAYEFLRSTYDAHKIPQNFGFGHGWVEGGPLLPVKAEFYQAGLGVEALRSLANLARLTGKSEPQTELQAAFEEQLPKFNQTFWSAKAGAYAFALDKQNQRVDEISVLTAVPMWFGLTDQEKSVATLRHLADADHQADWGMRIISNRSPIYNGSGYHFGSVWPLFTGWASVAEYRYHQQFSAYENLRANALLALDGSLGHVAEVLSGDFYQPLSTNSPHQIWSAAMVISPLLRGLFGLDTSVPMSTLHFAPHVPANWQDFSIDNIPLGTAIVSLHYHKELDTISIDALRTGGSDCWLEFSPALSPLTEISSIELTQPGKSARSIAIPRVTQTDNDQHVSLRIPLAQGKNQVSLRLKNDFGLTYGNVLPPLGSASEGLRVISEAWNPGHTQLKLVVSAIPGRPYSIFVWNPSQIASIRGGNLLRDATGKTGELVIDLPQVNPALPSAPYVHGDVVIEFVKHR